MVEKDWIECSLGLLSISIFIFDMEYRCKSPLKPSWDISIMNHSDLVELRNKMIHLYQAVQMIESGQYDLNLALTLMKFTSKSAIDLLDEEYYDIEETGTPSI